MPLWLRKCALIGRLIYHALGFVGPIAYDFLASFTRRLLVRGRSRRGRPSSEHGRPPRNIVIIGASFAGYFAAQTLIRNLAGTDDDDDDIRIVVIEPRSHFHFTWVLPRYCVVPGHEHKAFIPYATEGSMMHEAMKEGRLVWVRDHVVEVDREGVIIKGEGKERRRIPYEYLIIATGSGAGEGLPSRVGSDDKGQGIGGLRKLQRGVEEASRIVVVGGGAAGVELAADAKDRFPGKSVTLVHSRGEILHRFGPELRRAAMERLVGELGVEVITGERTITTGTGAGGSSSATAVDDGYVTLKSGRRIECDFLINCTGQKPSSGLLESLVPDALSPSGNILVRPTLQIEDDTLQNVYACGDVTEMGVSNANSRAAGRQAWIAAKNVLAAATGKGKTYTYVPFWGDELIKVTLGLDRSVGSISDGETELLIRSREKDVALMAAQAWKQMGATPFRDNGMTSIDNQASDDIFEALN